MYLWCREYTHIRYNEIEEFLFPFLTQRLVCFGLTPGVGSREPSLAIYEYDDKWNLVQHQLHHIDGLNYAHDFLLLRDYYVFHMTPFADMTLTAALKVFTGLSSPGELMKYHSHLPSRFVVIPRHKKAPYQEVKLLDTEPFHVSACAVYMIKIQSPLENYFYLTTEGCQSNS